MRSASTRKRERRQLKHLAEHGKVQLSEPVDKNDIARTVDILIRQKSQAFARMGVADLMAKPGYQAFYRAITTDDDARAFIHVSRLDVGSLSAAANLGLTFRDSYYLVLSSYHDGEIARCVLWLCSPEARSITGQSIPIAGGEVMTR